MKINIWVILFFLTTVSFGQSAFQVSGTIIDESSQPIPYVNIVFHSQPDSAFVTGGITDENGHFSIPVAAGKYFISATFLSYDKYTTSITVDTNISLPEITLRDRTKTLNEVVIVGERSAMELQLDKRVFNVEKDLSNMGASAADVLNNLPSVNVDPDGAVSLRGSENVRILIDGRPSGLTSRDPDALRKLQGNLIERIEVITNPSSRYDAAGEVGIINIIMKKNQDKGINGSLMGSVGHPTFYGGSAVMNFRRKSVNFFANYGTDFRSRPGFGSSFQRFNQSDSSYTQDNDRRSEELSHNFVIGLDVNLSERSTLSTSFNYNISDGLNTSLTTYQDFVDDVLIRTVLRTEREHEDEKNIEGAVNFKHEFKRKNQELVFDFKWIQSVDNETIFYTEGEAGTIPLRQDALNLADEINWQGQLDYIHPIFKSGKFETGIKSASRKIRNEFVVQQENEEGEWESDSAFNNNLEYLEYVHAGYLMASNSFNKLSIQAGLRGEWTDIRAELLASELVNTQNYFNIFPSASLSYALKENRTLQFSYSYRISRPHFRNLMPFNDLRDSRSYFVGNPNLRPEFTHAVEAGYLLEWGSGSVLSSVYHRARKGVIQRIVSDPDSVGRTQIIPINLSEENAYGFEFNINFFERQLVECKHQCKFISSHRERKL